MTVFGGGRIKDLGHDGRTGRRTYRIECAFSCDQCRRLSVGAYTGPVAPNDATNPALVSFYNQRVPTEWAPNYIDGQSFPDVPTHISEAAGEAHKSNSIGSFKSAILMARTVVEATAKDKGVTTGSLFKKIDELANQNVIQEFTKQTAHSIRQFGNDMAHGDIELPVDEEDVEMVLGFMDALLAEVFQTPARLAALQAKIAARTP